MYEQNYKKLKAMALAKEEIQPEKPSGFLKPKSKPAKRTTDEMLQEYMQLLQPAKES